MDFIRLFVISVPCSTHRYVFSKNSLSYLHWIDLTLFANPDIYKHIHSSRTIHMMSFSHSRQTPCVYFLYISPRIVLHFAPHAWPQKICLLHSYRMPFRILFSSYTFLSIHVCAMLHTQHVCYVFSYSQFSLPPPPPPPIGQRFLSFNMILLANIKNLFT